MAEAQKNIDPKAHFLELLRKYNWNEAVRIMREERMEAERGNRG